MGARVRLPLAAAMQLLLVILGLFLARNASAALPSAEERIELKPVAPQARVEPAPDLIPDWRILRPPVTHESRPIELKLPRLGPESLDLDVRWKQLDVSIAADLGNSRIPITPRLECDPNETYFWVRGSFDVACTDELKVTIFGESFQGAGAILGSDRLPPRFVWDGLQVQAGVLVVLPDGFSFEGGPVLYLLSASGRPEQIGGRFGIRATF